MIKSMFVINIFLLLCIGIVIEQIICEKNHNINEKEQY